MFSKYMMIENTTRNMYNKTNHSKMYLKMLMTIKIALYILYIHSFRSTTSKNNDLGRKIQNSIILPSGSKKTNWWKKERKKR